MDRIKKIKIKQQDGTMSDYYPIGADAQNIDFINGYSLDQIVGDINPDEEGSIKNQLADLKEKTATKRDNFEFCGAYNVVRSGVYDQLYTVEEQYARHIEWWKQANIKKCCVSINVCPLRSERLEYEAGTRTWEQLHWTTVPSTQQLIEHFEMLEENGIDCYHVKFHANWLRDTVPDTVSMDTKCAKFAETVLTFFQNVNKDFEWIGIFNEWGSSYTYTDMVNFINQLKTYGKVCLEGDRGILDYPNLIEAVDGFCPHFYASCGQLGEETDLEFAKNRMLNSYVFERMLKWTAVSNKPILLGEGGCSSYWNALAHPESWSFTDELVPNGAPQIIWLRAAFETLSAYKDRLIYFNFWWTGKGNAIQLIKDYQEGRYNE